MRRCPSLSVGLLPFLAASALIIPARADVQIKTQIVAPGGKIRETSMALAGHKAKMDMGQSVVIVDADSGKMLNLMKGQKQYMEIDMGAVQARIAGAMSMMKQRLHSMPEGQRKQIEAMLAKRGLAPGGMGGTPVTTAYQSTGGTETIGAWTCRVYHLTRNGVPEADLCIARADEIGLSADDMAAFRAFSAAMTKSMPAGVAGNATADIDAQTKQIGFVGMPIKTTIFANGAPQLTSTVTAIDHPTLGPDTFAVPPDYVRKTFP